MKTLFKKGVAFIGLSLISLVLLFAEETPINHLYSYTLDNGLSVFVAENHSAPLVYIEVAVRAGSIAQTPENAGLFHLYEHMMFKGNSKYRNSQAMQTALNNMGVSSWNGTTSIDRVNYFITVPVDQFEKGLEFWSYAIREPLMVPKEFEDEKKVVISEIQGYYGQPSEQQTYFTTRTLFPEAPWTFDAGGPVEVVQNATIEQLRDIQHKYYIPNNAAVLVGGDVDPDQACQLVKKVFGDWEAGEDPWKDEGKAYNVNPLDQPLYCVIPYDELSPEFLQVIVTWRGPDSDFNVKDTYTADVLAKVLLDPNGAFKKALVKNKKLNIPNSDYLWAGHQTFRHHGLFAVNGVMLKPSKSYPEQVKAFYDTLMNKAFPALQKDKSLESAEKRKLLLQSIKDNRAFESESAQGLLSILSFYWTYAPKDYFLTYDENLMKVEKKDLDPYLENYIYSRNPIVKVLVNPQVYEETKADFDAAGFVQITADNAFWWSEK